MAVFRKYRNNIAYGKPDAGQEEVIAAAKAAHAHSFIQRLPNGYDTVISEDGGNLSQGQKQLLCIARVMLTKPPMLILDEATSSIDTRTELMIQKAFQKLMEGRTSFVVAHRLSTIRESDHILVMDKGHIVEQGTHEELLAKNGFMPSSITASLNRRYKKSPLLGSFYSVNISAAIFLNEFIIGAEAVYDPVRCKADDPDLRPY